MALAFSTALALPEVLAELVAIVLEPAPSSFGASVLPVDGLANSIEVVYIVIINLGEVDHVLHVLVIVLLI